ncbi:MAG: hypothetical protein PSV17_01295 [Methylotenera sp.]|uniref:hypothetical protein n=1 Tax=Methylotenera sp. TaxID=2051956 RepID=UPI002489D53A|nr:hypothetical protein [Methylotenera sp.]MDI1308054.1 hypothetical protein [Methylotenera sp.]
MKQYIQHRQVGAWHFFAMLSMLSVFMSEKVFAADNSVAVNASAVALKNKYTELSKQLENNQFNRALYLHSEETSRDLKGEIYAVVDYPFSTFNSALSNPAHWCDAMILNLNVKYCHMANNQNGNILTLNIGKKHFQPLADTYRIEFKYPDIISTPNYFMAEFDAKEGPLGTSDYRILIEATPLKDGHTFLHFTYAYSFGVAGRLAMQTYLSTIGRGKLGFTITGKQAGGEPKYIQGIRGVVERNTMRYYLAVDAYLAGLTAPADDRLDKSLQTWYRNSEQYSSQLHEVELDEYLDMKRKEYQRQQKQQ